MPEMDKKQLSLWLRAFFDCEGWVENQPRKSRTIRLDCINEKGLNKIKNELKKFKINSSVKKRKRRDMWRLSICGLDNLNRFYKNINFLHPAKKKKLRESINSYTKFHHTKILGTHKIYK